MKVIHISASASGGAGQVARLVSDGLTHLGADSSVINLYKSSLREDPFGSAQVTLAAGLDEYVVSKSTWQTPVSLLRAELGNRLEKLSADIFHLHWPWGFFNLSQIRNLPGNLVVTAHDDRFLTGACHYSQECDGWKSGCGNCPAVKPAFQKLAVRSWSEITDLVRRRGVQFIAPSKGLAEKLSLRFPAEWENVETIPNPVSLPNPGKIPRSARNQQVVFAVIAANLREPRKQFGASLRTYEALHEDLDSRLVTVGGNRPLVPLAPKESYLGALDHDQLMSQLAGVDFLIHSSTDEIQPLTILESMARGVVVIAEEGSSGLENFIFGEDYVSGNDLRQMFSDPDTAYQRLDEIRQSCLEKIRSYDSLEVARRHLELYRRFTAREFA